MKKVSRNFKTNESEFIQKADSLLKTAERDMAALAAYGIDTAYLDAVRIYRNRLADLPTAQEDEGDIMQRTEEKDALRLSVTKEAKRMNARLTIPLPTNPKPYKKGYIFAFTRLSDNELHRSVRAQCRALLEYLPVLSPDGLTMTLINDLKAMNESFFEAVLEKDFAEGNAMINTEERIKAGNSMFTLMNVIIVAGKSAFAKEPARYNDYRVSEKKHAGTVSVTFRPGSGETWSLNLSFLPPDTVISLSNLNKKYEALAWFGPSPASPLPANPLRLVYRKRTRKPAKQFWFQPADRPVLYIHNPSPAPLIIRLRMPVKFRKEISKPVKAG